MTVDPDAAQTRALHETAPLAGLIGVEILSASGEEVRGRMAWRPDLCTVAGVLHGGAIMAFADTIGSLCAFLNMEEGEVTSTIESKANFFRAVREGHVEGVGRPLHVGRTTIVVQTDLLGPGGRRVAQVTQTQARRRPGP